MKNLISNNCIGARLYKINNCQFINPFCWSGIDIDNFIILIENYDNINMENIEIKLEKCGKHWQGGKENPYIIIDNKVIVHFRHYLQNDDIDRNIITEVNIESNNIIEYAKEKWLSRLNKGKELSPTFFYSFNYELFNDDKLKEIYKEKINRLVLSNSKYPLIILAHKSMEDYCKIKKINENIQIIWMPNNEFICKYDDELGRRIDKYINVLDK